jgi:transposase
MTIPAVGPITALTWVLEVDDVTRFGTVKQASISGSLTSSASLHLKRMP